MNGLGQFSDLIKVQIDFSQLVPVLEDLHNKFGLHEYQLTKIEKLIGDSDKRHAEHTEELKELKNDNGVIRNLITEKLKPVNVSKHQMKDKLLFLFSGQTWCPRQ